MTENRTRLRHERAAASERAAIFWAVVVVGVVVAIELGVIALLVRAILEGIK